jgi:hypothetical protein
LDELAESSWGTYLAAIDKTVIELRDVCSSLQHRTELFENMTNSLVTHTQHVETIITREQSKLIQALTVITIVSHLFFYTFQHAILRFGVRYPVSNSHQFYLPPTLAFTIFSMQSVLPTNVVLKYWIYTLVGLFLITTVLVINLPHITKFFQFLRDWQHWYWGWLWEVVRNMRHQGMGDEEQEGFCG